MWKIYFVRHGQTDRNLKGIMNPWDVDSELNETWVQQAIDSWREARDQGLEFDVIVSSPLKRAIDTAKTIAEKTSYKWDIVVYNRLKEQLAWKFKNYSHDELKSEFDITDTEQVRRLFKSKKYNWIEDISEFIERVTSWFQEIKEKYADKNVLIVGHSGVARVVFINSLWLDEDTTIFKTHWVQNAKILDTEVNPFKDNQQSL